MIRRVALLTLAALACTPSNEPAAYPGPPAPSPDVMPTPSSSGMALPAPSGSPGCGKAAARSGAFVAQHIQAAGHDRTYTLVIPEGYAPQTPYPLVFVLHGGGGSASAARGQTDLEKVSAGRALFVYPDGTSGTWDLDTPTQSNGDVALFDAVSLVVHNTLCVDPRRLYVTGFSNGAYMANQLGCRRGERIRGIATHAGGGPYDSHGSYDAQGNLVCPGKAVAALVVHGTSDGTVAPAEGQKSIDHWSHANGCRGGGGTSTLVAPCVALPGCGQPVAVCRIPGLGHSLWKEAGKVTWTFFDSLR